MMKPIGRALIALCALALALAGTAARAEVSASLDRDRVAMGDTLRLTITATQNEDTSSTDLRPLLADFEISRIIDFKLGMLYSRFNLFTGNQAMIGMF